MSQQGSGLVGLDNAYAALQLDPYDVKARAAANAFFWQHILERIELDYITQIREGRIKLAENFRYDRNLRHTKWSAKLNDIAYDLVRMYAHILWPVENYKRAHLTSTLLDPRMAEMRASTQNLRMSNRTRDKFKKAHGQNIEITAQVSQLESLVGQNVRWYLKCLLESSEPVPKRQSVDARKLLWDFLDMHTDSDLEEGEIRESPLRKRRRTSDTFTRTQYASRAAEGRREVTPSLPMKRAHLSREESEAYGRTRKRLYSRSLTLSSPSDHLRDTTRFLPNSSQCSSRDREDIEQESTKSAVVHLRSPFTLSGSERLASVSSSSTMPSLGSSRGTEEAEKSSNHDQQDFKLALARGLRTGPGRLATTETIIKYCCWLVTCTETYQTSEQLIAHIKDQHSGDYQDFIEAAIGTGDDPSQQHVATDIPRYYCWVATCIKGVISLKQLSEHFERKHSDEYLEFLDAAIASGQKLPQQSSVVPELLHSAESGETEIKDATELPDETPSIEACEALHDLQVAQAQGNVFDETHVARVRRAAAVRRI